MFKYFGSKYRLVDAYPPPRLPTIVEPFAGSASYAVRHGADRRVVLVEKDKRVIDLWLRLIGMSAHEIRCLADPIEGTRSTDLLVAFAAGRTTRDTPTESFVVSPRMAQRFRPMINRIAATVDSCRHFEIVEGDYSTAPDIEATWFIDPPYHPTGGRWDRTRGGRYAHPNVDIDYRQLSTWVRNRSGQVIVCEQEGADWLPFDHVIATRSNTHASYAEQWWTNESTTLDLRHPTSGGNGGDRT